MSSSHKQGTYAHLPMTPVTMAPIPPTAPTATIAPMATIAPIVSQVVNLDTGELRSSVLAIERSFLSSNRCSC